MPITREVNGGLLEVLFLFQNTFSVYIVWAVGHFNIQEVNPLSDITDKTHLLVATSKR